MNNNDLNISIDNLDLSSKISEKLKELQINKIESLWKCKKEYLKENKFTDSEIAQIKIKLQLYGIDLNKKIYKKN